MFCPRTNLLVTLHFALRFTLVSCELRMVSTIHGHRTFLTVKKFQKIVIVIDYEKGLLL